MSHWERQSFLVPLRGWILHNENSRNLVLEWMQLFDL